MRGNRKGPDNRGPKTGRSMGFCTGHNHPGCYYGGNQSQGQEIIDSGDLGTCENVFEGYSQGKRRGLGLRQGLGTAMGRGRRRGQGRNW